MKQFLEFVNGLSTKAVEPVSISYMDTIGELLLEQNDDRVSSMYEIQREFNDSEEIEPLP